MKTPQWIDSRTLAKTSTYWVVHVSVAALVAYLVTGDFLTSMTLSLLEPTVQAFAFFAHEKLWEQKPVLTSMKPEMPNPEIT